MPLGLKFPGRALSVYAWFRQLGAYTERPSRNAKMSPGLWWVRFGVPLLVMAVAWLVFQRDGMQNSTGY
jgi:hypothetical protein